jgi:hypothetical protein
MKDNKTKLKNLLLVLIVLNLSSCEKSYTITTRHHLSNPSQLISKVKKDDISSEELQLFLNSDEKPLEANMKFPLCYYLIEEEDLRLLYHQKLDKRITDQLFMIISGVKYYKLFVQPKDILDYQFLSHAYRFIGPEETEFMAIAIDGKDTLAIWNKKNSYKKPFISTSKLDDRYNFKQKYARIPAQLEREIPESVSLIFKRIVGNNKKIEGQFITALPIVKSTP